MTDGTLECKVDPFFAEHLYNLPRKIIATRNAFFVALTHGDEPNAHRLFKKYVWLKYGKRFRSRWKALGYIYRVDMRRLRMNLEKENT